MPMVKLNGKVVGKLEESNGHTRLHKRVNPKKHLFHVYNGYAIQKDIFDDILLGKDGDVVIEEIGGDTYVAPISTWEEKGKLVDYGYGAQIVLPVDDMAVEEIVYES